MKFEIHCHSHYSRGKNIPTEGTASPAEILRTLRARGFSGVAITDHDSVKAWKEASGEARKAGMVFIPACEVSTLDGHLIGLGLTESVRGRTPVEEAIEAVRSQGGIAVAPHPFDLRNEGLGGRFSLCDAAEAFNSLNLTRIENRKAGRRIGKSGIAAVGGSDAHTPEMLGLTINHIDASTADEVLSAIRKGKVRIEGRYAAVPAVVRWARERMRRSYPDVIRYVEVNYSRPKAVFSKFMVSRFVRSESPLWNCLGYMSVGMAAAYSALREASGR